MRKKTKYLLIIIGVALIIFGALIPTVFKVEKDKLSFFRDMGFSEYTCSVTITSKNDYEISSAIVYFEDFFGDQEMTKEVSSSSITKEQQGENFIYTFVVYMQSFGEYSEFTKIDKVKLNTNLGTRIATESSFKWTTPVMIITIIAGVVLVIVGTSMISSEKIQKSLAEKARKELAQSNPEIDTSNMTDVEVLNKQAEIRRANVKSPIDSLSSLFGIEQKPTDWVCEYCGSTNKANETKCSSCGASVKTKK